MFLIFALAAVAPALAGQDIAPLGGSQQDRLAECTRLAGEDPAQAEQYAARWRLEGGAARARQCLGLALANQQRFDAAGDAFEDAAREADGAHDPEAATFWAQAGNARLAAGQVEQAATDLDAALGAGTLRDLALGEAYLDRARVRVAAGDMTAAREDIDRAQVHAGDDPMAWLLSATLARRMHDLARAQRDIDEAVRVAGGDASVQLEAGNIAALRGDGDAARTAWEAAARLAPGSPIAAAAQAALAQFAQPAPSGN